MSGANPIGLTVSRTPGAVRLVNLQDEIKPFLYSSSVAHTMYRHVTLFFNHYIEALSSYGRNQRFGLVVMS